MKLRSSSPPARLRPIATGLALLTAGTFVGISSQQFAGADVTSGDRPVLVPIEPCRLADTRPAPNQVGPRAVPLGAGDVHTVDAQQQGTPCTDEIPADATALSLNVTALGATEFSYLTIWSGGDRPLTASLNPAPGQPPVPNAVTAELSVDQEFEIYNNAGTVDVVIDVNGYYADHNHDDRYMTRPELDELVDEAIQSALTEERRRHAGRTIAMGQTAFNAVLEDVSTAEGFTVSSEVDTGSSVIIRVVGPFSRALDWSERAPLIVVSTTQVDSFCYVRDQELMQPAGTGDGTFTAIVHCSTVSDGGGSGPLVEFIVRDVVS
ncbi:hypothetical protein [Ilumatobacter coccineus]|jgi:hypothetical protein|uniref:Uncharacterized protein n=1 Tax=Ilumatobacter coccineus (strain NBRC 103263 / KCTC 29153 / YM16-304) TaxID=1313172 RepID=A0A6C7EAR0_ILUCY|nr:hypothetical protein [Ilumatobacter coccineus]BAN01116.1 hypothetical protein YM304_08020 [Ilumatobacter coccineus YM16-304]